MGRNPMPLNSDEAELKAFFYLLAKDKIGEARKKGQYAMAAMGAAVLYYLYNGVNSILDYAVMFGCGGTTVFSLYSAYNDFNPQNMQKYLEDHPEVDAQRIIALANNIGLPRTRVLCEEAFAELAVDYDLGKKVEIAEVEEVPSATVAVMTNNQELRSIPTAAEVNHGASRRRGTTHSL